MKICEATDADHDEIWRIFHEVVAAGDTYAFIPTRRVKVRSRIGLRVERTRMSPSRNLQGTASPSDGSQRLPRWLSKVETS